ARLVAQESGETRIRIETAAGLLDAELTPNGDVAVDMGPARTAWHEIPLAREMDTTRAALALGPLTEPVCTNIGNPHATFFVPDAEAIDLAALGPRLEHDKLFPERANIDRKSTRLNSSHVAISYAVFCLKKKIQSAQSAS